MKHRLRFYLVIFCAALVLPSFAQPRASVDRDRIALGESVTLTITTDQITALPDFSLLTSEFEISNHASSRQVRRVNGTVSQQTLRTVDLRPRRAGKFFIPAIRVGSQRTAAVRLTVVDAAPAPQNFSSNSEVFLELVADDNSPYTQQAVGLSLRLYHTTPLVSGSLNLDQPEGASLKKIGDDVNSTKTIDGREYQVVERRFVLIPERSGELVIPAAKFSGRGVGGWVDDLLGGNSRVMQATSPSLQLQVQAQPAAAPQPWLPLQGMDIRYTSTPQNLRAGEATALAVEITARGAQYDQLKDLPALAINGAQVFPEQLQYNETFVNGTIQVKLTRRYTIVPNGSGILLIPGLSIQWLNVNTAQTEMARLPNLSLEVAQGDNQFATATLPALSTNTTQSTPNKASVLSRFPQGSAQLWSALALGFAGLWVTTLVWALRRHRPLQLGSPSGSRLQMLTPSPQSKIAAATHMLTDLRRTLDTGSLDEVGEVLCGMSSPPCQDIDQLISQLYDERQRDAVIQLQRARWADGDGVATRAELRKVFINGPKWMERSTIANPTLPPLYPDQP